VSDVIDSLPVWWHKKPKTKSHQKGKIMIMIMKTPGSQVDSPVAEGNRREGGGRKIRDLHKDT